MSLIDMRGKVALVTGVARGIGRGIVAALARGGASVAIADLRADLVEHTALVVARDTGAQVVAHKQMSPILPKSETPLSMSCKPSEQSVC